MGKRKQKIKWCSVDAVQWSQDEQACTSDGSAGVVKGSAVPGSGGGTRRSSAQGWTSSLALRFERKVAAEAEQKHIYYEGEFCEAEDLPNGFTKIRSKNLDILFKRDFYEQKQLLAEQVTSSESCATAEVTEEVQEEEKGLEEAEIKSPTSENMDGMTEPDKAAKSSSGSFDQINPDDIQEFKPMNPRLVSLSCDSSPSYGSYPPHPQYPDSSYPPLYLYSPSNNSLIPCEEIIIPYPVMSPEGPVYSGPTDIYLAYPVQGPDGKGYITQPFATPGYSSSISYDGSNYYSSTPQDSGSSTLPTSPLPLATYHSTNWVNQDQPSLFHHVRDTTEGCFDPQPIQSPTEKSSSTVSTTTPGSTAASIPGLSMDSKRKSPKKSQKKRKKKVTSSSEQLRSSSSESENMKMEEYARHENSESIHDKIYSEQFTGMLDPEVTAEPIQEVYLTDDLADSLVNPPTEPEISDEEISQDSISIIATYSSVEVSENKLGVAEKEIKMAEVESIETETELVPEIESIEATEQSEVLENCSGDSNMENIVHTEEKKEALEGEFNADIKCGEPCNVPVKKVEDRIETSSEVVKAVPEIKKLKKKTRTRNQKEDLDLVLKSESESRVLKSEVQSTTCQAMKASYSSVMKSNIVRESNNNPTFSCKPNVETVTVPSPLPNSSDNSAVLDNNEKHSDTWKKVPLKSFKPELQGKISKKRRNNTRTIIEDSLLLEELPELEIVPQLEKCSKPLKETNQMQQEADPKADNLCDDIEVVKRKCRKKKKFESQNTSHRVIICDDQIEIHYSKAVRRAPEVLPTSILDTVKTSGYCDFLVIRELGSGISRGCMHYDRLYQGKYIPPERTDGLPAWCEEESVKCEEGIAEVVIGEESSSTASADIDLD